MAAGQSPPPPAQDHGAPRPEAGLTRPMRPAGIQGTGCCGLLAARLLLTLCLYSQPPVTLPPFSRTSPPRSRAVRCRHSGNLRLCHFAFQGIFRRLPPWQPYSTVPPTTADFEPRDRTDHTNSMGHPRRALSATRLTCGIRKALSLDQPACLTLKQQLAVSQSASDAVHRCLDFPSPFCGERTHSRADLEEQCLQAFGRISSATH
jgi:hypothetical protein